MEKGPVTEVKLSYEEKMALYEQFGGTKPLSPETRAKLQPLTLAEIIGPTAGGKTTIMRKLEELDPERFAMVQNETTREMADSEKKHGSEYIHHQEEPVIDDIKAGRLVQFMVHPNNVFYFTRPEDYPVGKTGLMAVIYSVVPEFRSKGFGTVHEFFIATPFAKLIHRTKLQAKDRHWSRDVYDERLFEGWKSHDFALKDDRIRFILNDKPDVAAQRIIAALDGQPIADEAKARDIVINNAMQLKAMVHGR